ncbi:MAG: hypothetical protein IBJ10_09770 [Phycisphaerales bacterium]|nr:hypothetical protein [Phycisphaerales bacterium]
MSIRIAAVVGAAAVASFQGRAELVVHTNWAQTFAWTASTNEGQGQYLDITQDATQSGAPPASGIYYFFRYPETFSTLGGHNLGSSAVRFATVAPTPFYDQEGEFYDDVPMMKKFNPTNLVGSQWTYSPGYAFLYAFYLLGQQGAVGGGASPPNSTFFVGVQLDVAGNTHYGWIELRPVFGPYIDGLHPGRFYAQSWAWETEPGVAARVIPAPGGAIVAAGVFGAVLRRRR